MSTGYSSRCNVCQSPERKLVIELALIRGASAESVAAKINEPINGQPVRFISAASIRRHRTHVPAALIQKLGVRALAGSLKNCDLETLRKEESEGLLQHCIAYRTQLDQLIDAAVFANNLGVAGQLIGKRNDLLNFSAKLLHEIGGSTTVVTNQNLLISPAYLQLRTALIKALQGPQFAAARLAVSAALAEVEQVQPLGGPEQLPQGTSAQPIAPDASARPLQLEDHSDAGIAK